MKYEKHIFICTNERTDGRSCCGQAAGMELVEKFKEELKKHQLKIGYRAQRAGCLDVCNNGPALVVYPEGVFYGNVKPEDIKEIVTEHILNNRPVKSLMIE
ncbi:MAG: (2Fe-2S) ferredoxin domain-containing protein [Cytophagaceae bacterium]